MLDWDNRGNHQWRMTSIKTLVTDWFNKSTKKRNKKKKEKYLLIQTINIDFFSEVIKLTIK